MSRRLSSECGFVLCLSVLAGWSCGDSTNANDTGRDASSSTDRDSASGSDDAAQEAGSKPDDSGPGADATTPNDAATDAATDAAVQPKPITATYVYQGGNGGDPYPFHTYRLNRNTGALTKVGADSDLGPSPTYVTPSADGRFLYVANESYAAGVTAASIGNDGRPTKLETQQVESGSSELNSMVFTSLSPNGKFVLAANYYGGRVVSFPVQGDGSLGAPVSYYAFGSGDQTHSVRTDLSGRYAYAPNRAANDVGQLLFDSTTGALTGNTPPTIAGDVNDDKPAGPRHVAIHPTKSYVYVANEDNSTITAYSIGSAGTLTKLESESALASGQVDGDGDKGAHVLVHPNGNYVYMSNRGRNDIAVFSIAENGTLTLLENESTRGDTPRNFDIDSEGELMVVANQDSGSLAVFRIAENGLLSPLGDLVEGLSAPNAVAIVNVRAGD
jgi:6-phosphogluconolactonase